MNSQMSRFRRWIVLALALILALVSARGRACADDPAAAALLAKHAAYAGWRGGDGSVKTLRESGEVTLDGKVLRRLRRLQMGPIYRTTGPGFDSGFTGRVFWQTNVNGFTMRNEGEVARYLATLSQIDDEELTALPGTVRGSETVDGVRTTIVRVVAQAGLPVDLCIDPETGAFKRIVVDPDGKYRERVDVLADTDVGGGKRVRSSWRVDDAKALFSFTKIELNGEITSEDLHPPKPIATWTFGPPAQTLPISVTDNRIYFDAVVNGHRGHFVFDSGAGLTAFTDSFARLVGAKREGNADVVGIGGGARANVYHVDTFTVGANTLHNLQIATGIDERPRDSGEAIDGYVGVDLLAGAIVDMDLDAQTMQLYDPATIAPDSSKGVVLRVDLTSGQPRIPMTIAGRTPVLATLDTGNTFYVLVSSELLGRDHVALLPPANALAARVTMVGINGEEVDTCGKLESLEVGPIAYRPVPACVSNSMSSNQVLVGFDFLKHLNYVFDYPDGEILLSARKKG
jgi:predicted aspartyl protease